MSQRINVGHIGYGFSTKCFHLPFVLPNKELNVYAFLQRAPAPADPKSAKPGSHCTVDYPDAKHYRTPEEFFADEKIDLVIVSSHTDTHADFATRALEAGKHVVVEKPFTRTSEEADALIAVAKKSGKILTCFQNRRWDGDFQTISRLLAEKALGTITEFENCYYIENPPWALGFPDKYTPGEGMLFGLGTHTIDQVLLLFGRPARVTCFHRANRGAAEGKSVVSDVDDTFMIVLEYDGEQKNLLVTVKTGITGPMREQPTVFVRGTEGTYLKYGTDQQEIDYFAGKSPSSDPETFGVEPERLHGTLVTLKEFDGKTQKYDEESKKWVGKYPTIKGRYLGYYENVVDAIKGRAELAVKPEHSRDGLRLIELARQSQKEHRAVEWS